MKMTIPPYKGKLLRQDTVSFMLSREHLYRPKLGIHGKIHLYDILPIFLAAGAEYCDRQLKKQANGEAIELPTFDGLLALPPNKLKKIKSTNHRVFVSTCKLLEQYEWGIRSLVDMTGHMTFGDLAHKLVVWGGYALEQEYKSH